MDRIPVEELYKRAYRYAMHKKPSDADDFAGWYLLNILEGRSVHQTIRQAFIDYLRGKYRKISAKVVFSDIAESEIEGSINYAIPSRIPGRLVAMLNSVGIIKMERAMFWLRYGWGFTESEIADCFGLSEGRISQILKLVKEKLQGEKS